MRNLITALTLAALCGFTGYAQKTPTPDAQLGAIIRQAEVELDFEGAIPRYKTFIAENGTNKPLTAKAYYHLGLAYAKVGSPEARTAFERVTKEFSTQKEAALARTQLGTGASDLNVSRIWTGDRRTWFSRVSPDGRYFIGSYGTEPGLVLYDTSSNTYRHLTTFNTILDCFTPDGKRIVYERNRDDGPPELGIVNVDGTGERAILSSNEYSSIEPSAISPDGKTVAVGLLRKDDTWQVGLVSLDTGKLTFVRDNGWRDTYAGNFSPDGRWLLYYAQLSKDAPNDGAVYAAAIDGSALNTLIPAHAAPAAPLLTPDGSRMLFRNSLSPKDLWSVRVTDGKPSGEPQPARSNIAQFLGFTRDGSLYYHDDVDDQGIYVADVDPTTWTMKSAPREIPRGVRDGQISEPAWSPDGKILGLAWTRPVAGGADDGARILLHSFDGAPDRELSTQTRAVNLRGWSPDGKSLVIVDWDKGLRLFDTATQRAQVILGPTPQIYLRGSVWDGKAVFYPTFDSTGPLGQPSKDRADTVRLMRHDLQTGEEREMFHAEALRRGPSGPFSVVLSPDGRNLDLGFLRPNGQAKHVLLPVSGGEPREIPSADYKSWTPDSKALLFIKSDEIWVQRLDGSAAYSTGIRLNGLGSPSVHPDGSRIAFTGVTRNQQVWAIKNLFPDTAAAKR